MAHRLMRVLLTRTEAENERVARVLRERGHKPVLAPLTRLQIFDGVELPLQRVQAVLVTSANGVHALARRTPRRDVPLFVVGPHCSETAVAARFTRVKQGPRDAAALAAKVCGWAATGAGALLHVAARDHNEELAQTLTKAGFDVRTEVAYATEAIPLSNEAVDVFRSNEIDAVMLFSSRSVRLFREQIDENGLQACCARMMALCISEAVRESLLPLSFAQTRVAQQPNLEAMLALLRR